VLPDGTILARVKNRSILEIAVKSPRGRRPGCSTTLAFDGKAARLPGWALASRVIAYAVRIQQMSPVFWNSSVHLIGQFIALCTLGGTEVENRGFGAFTARRRRACRT
jgi:hypothetical protein